MVYGEDNVSQEECRSLNDFNFGFILGGFDLLLDVPMSTSWASMPPELAPSQRHGRRRPLCFQRIMKPWARCGSGRRWTVAGRSSRMSTDRPTCCAFWMTQLCLHPTPRGPLHTMGVCLNAKFDFAVGQHAQVPHCLKSKGSMSCFCCSSAGR